MSALAGDILGGVMFLIAIVLMWMACFDVGTWGEDEGDEASYKANDHLTYTVPAWRRRGIG